MLKVLIVDDDKNMKTLMDLYLKRFEVYAEIDQVYCAKDAEKCVGDKHDLWIMDHRLPNTTGIEFLNSHKINRPFIYGSFYLDKSISDKIEQMGGIPMDKNNMLCDPEVFAETIRKIPAHD